MTFQPGLQTHFPNGRIDLRFLEEVRPRVYWCRMDVQHADRDKSLEIYYDIESRGLVPLVTVWEGSEVLWFPAGTHFEYQNERSITLNGVPAISGGEYRQGFDTDFYPAVQEVGGIPYYGAAANFEDRDLNWYRAGHVQSLPADVRFTIHDYWTRFLPTLRSRLRLWRDIIGEHREYLISECGVNTSPSQAIADYMRKKWDFWKEQDNCLGLVYFQIFDDVPNNIPMGLFDADYQLKQVVFHTFPLVTEQEPAMLVATEGMHRRNAIPRPNGKFAYKLSADTVMSVQPNGDVESRPITAIGAWEEYTDDGTRAMFEIEGKAFFFPLAG